MARQNRQEVHISRIEFATKFQDAFGGETPEMDTDKDGTILIRTKLQLSDDKNYVVNQDYIEAHPNPNQKSSQNQKA